MKSLFSTKLKKREEEIVKMWETYREVTNNVFLWGIGYASAVVGGFNLPPTIVYGFGNSFPREMIPACLASMVAAILMVKCIRNRFPTLGEVEEMVSQQERDIEREFGISECTMSVEAREYYMVREDEEIAFECEGDVLVEYVSWLREELRIEQDLEKVKKLIGWLVLAIIGSFVSVICIAFGIEFAFVVENVLLVISLILAIVVSRRLKKMERERSAADDKMIETLEKTFAERLPNARLDLGKTEILGWRMEPDIREVIEKIEATDTQEGLVIIRQDKMKVELLVGHIVKFLTILDLFGVAVAAPFLW